MTLRRLSAGNVGSGLLAAMAAMSMTSIAILVVAGTISGPQSPDPSTRSDTLATARHTQVNSPWIASSDADAEASPWLPSTVDPIRPTDDPQNPDDESTCSAKLNGRPTETDPQTSGSAEPSARRTPDDSRQCRRHNKDDG